MNVEEQGGAHASNNEESVTIRKELIGGFKIDELLTVRGLLNAEVEDNDETRQVFGVVFLPGYPQSVYPKNVITRLFSEADSSICRHDQRLYHAFMCANLVLVCILLTVSIILQSKKESWDLDYDIAPMVWMILAGMASLSCIFIFGAVLSNRRMLGSKEDHALFLTAVRSIE